MVSVLWNTLQVMNIKVNGKWDYFMVKVYINIQMEMNMKEIILMIKNKELVHFNVKMVNYMLANLNKD